MVGEIGVLLVNLGTPKSPAKRDVYRYLVEFLTDGRVIDIPWLKRQLLVRGMIVPRRYRTSATYYKQIWQEEGSPLLIYGKKVKQHLQEKLGSDFQVALAMRYQTPSIGEALTELAEVSPRQLIVVPLFPQYASATTGSVYEKIMEELRGWNVIPETSFINNYATHPLLIEAFAENILASALSKYDHLLFSFHGLPERHVLKASQGCCLKQGCCQQLHNSNANCYSAQCYATAHAIAARLGLSSNSYSICFQSRLGREPWLHPYTTDVLHSLLQEGHRRLLVSCPSFVADCLETLYEIGVEYREEFKKGGGETLDLVEGLNDSATFIATLEDLVRKRVISFDRGSAMEYSALNELKARSCVCPRQNLKASLSVQ